MSELSNGAWVNVTEFQDTLLRLSVSVSTNNYMEVEKMDEYNIAEKCWGSSPSDILSYGDLSPNDMWSTIPDN